MHAEGCLAGNVPATRSKGSGMRIGTCKKNVTNERGPFFAKSELADVKPIIVLTRKSICDRGEITQSVVTNI